MPKQISGCYNCSQRRIKCDQTRPHCNKCIRKGLECPGYGIRYRFNAGVASRGKFTGRNVPVDDSTPVSQHARSPATTTLLWPDGSLTQNTPSPPSQPLADIDGVGVNMPGVTTCPPRLDIDPHATVPFESLDFSNTFGVTPDNASELPEVLDIETGNLTQALTLFRGVDMPPSDSLACLLCNTIHPPSEPCASILNSLEMIDPQSRELFAHFSTSIANVMVVLDGRFNGYRHLILPLACEDDLVKAAVSVASMFHLAPQRPELRSSAEAGFQRVVRLLRERTSLSNNLLDMPAWTTLIVLLTSETITGGSNLPYLFKALQHLADANMKDGQASAMHAFLKEQTRMMTLFAQPLLGEDAGAVTLRAHPDAYFEFFSNAAMFHPDLAVEIDIYKSAIRCACNLYLTRATRGPPHSETVEELEYLRSLCEQVHSSTPGHHTLVWVYFIAAAESSTLAHREFFTQRLQEVFSRTRFHNIPTALRALQELWKVQAERRWTEILPEVMPVFII